MQRKSNEWLHPVPSWFYLYIDMMLHLGNMDARDLEIPIELINSKLQQLLACHPCPGCGHVISPRQDTLGEIILLAGLDLDLPMNSMSSIYCLDCLLALFPVEDE